MNSIFRFLVIVAALAGGFVRLASAEDMPMKAKLVSGYVKIVDALAADDLGGAKAAAGALAEHAGMAGQKEMADQSGGIAQAANISAAREQFKALSLSIEPLAAGVDGYTVMSCALAQADWVQTGGDVRNPYFGKSNAELWRSEKGGGCVSSWLW